jgi:DNA-binding CsgD family transcriptional regulator
MVCDAILRPIAERLGASAGAFFQLSMQNECPLAVEHSVQQGPFGGAAELYSRDLFRNDPLFTAQSSTPATLKVLVASPAGKKSNTRIQQLFVNNGIGDIVGIYFPLSGVTGAKILQISFPRHVDMPDYTAADLALLEELAPTLRPVLSNLALARDTRILESMVSALAGRLDSEIRLIDDRTGAGYSCGPGKPMSSVSRCAEAGDRLCDLSLPEHLSLWLVPTRGSNRSDAYGLTIRECEVVDALRAGHNNPSMAHALGISVRTVENHLRSIFAKVGVSSRTQLVMKLVAH